MCIFMYMNIYLVVLLMIDNTCESPNNLLEQVRGGMDQ